MPVRVLKILLAVTAAAVLCSEGHAQRRPSILIDVPQYPNWSFPRGDGTILPLPEGKPFGDYLRSKGADVEELPRTRPEPWEPAKRVVETTAEWLSGRDIVVRVGTVSSDREVAAYHEYVSRGGKLLLLSDFVRPGERDALAESFGVRLMGITKGENVIDRFVVPPHPITRNVRPLSCGGIPPYDEFRGCGSAVISVTGENVTLLANLSERTYVDLDFDKRKDPEEPVGAAVLGVIEVGRGVVVFLTDSNTLEPAPQPLTENIYNFLMNYKPSTQVPVSGHSGSRSAPPQTFSGIVVDTAFRPLDGARAEVLDGPQAGLTATTDAEGRYVLPGLFTAATTVRVVKEGYVTSTRTWTPPICRAGDACNATLSLLNFGLGLPTSVDLAGEYTLTIAADSTCAQLPAEARSRKYTASIVPEPDFLVPYSVRLSGASFWSGISSLSGVSSFEAGVAGDYVAFFLDRYDGPTEQISPNTYIMFSGHGVAESVARGAPVISASLDGTIEYFALRSPLSPWDGPEGRSSPDRWADPTPERPVTYGRCESKNHRIVLTRR